MFKSAMLILVTVAACFTIAVVESEGKKPLKSPILNIDAPSKYNELTGYTVSAEVYSDREISHVIFITPSERPDKLTESFLFAVPPYKISNPYSAGIGESFDVYVIATDKKGNATKDFVTINRIPNPPDLVQSGWGIVDGYFEHIDVVNQGETATAESGFFVDFYNTVDPPELGQVSTFCRVLVDHPVAPKERIFIDVTTLFPIPVSEVWVQVDTDGDIDEYDETNNINYLIYP